MILNPPPQRPVSLGNLSTGGGRRRSVIAITSRLPGKQGRRPSCYDLPTFSRQHTYEVIIIIMTMVIMTCEGTAQGPGLLSTRVRPLGASLEVPGPGGLQTGRRASETVVRKSLVTNGKINLHLHPTFQLYPVHSKQNWKAVRQNMHSGSIGKLF